MKGSPGYQNEEYRWRIFCPFRDCSLAYTRWLRLLCVVVQLEIVPDCKEYVTRHDFGKNDGKATVVDPDLEDCSSSTSEGP